MFRVRVPRVSLLARHRVGGETEVFVVVVQADDRMVAYDSHGAVPAVGECAHEGVKDSLHRVRTLSRVGEVADAQALVEFGRRQRPGNAGLRRALDSAPGTRDSAPGTRDSTPSWAVDETGRASDMGSPDRGSDGRQTGDAHPGRPRRLCAGGDSGSHPNR